jgi:PEGA domain
MNAAQVPVRPPDRPGFTDGLGTRSIITESSTGETLELLTLRPELVRVASFEFALRERAARLANFRHEDFSRVRRIDRAPGGGLGIVSDYIAGARLSEVLQAAADRKLPLDVGAAFCLVRQLVPAVAFLHDNARDVAHGALALERLIVTPLGRLMIVEHVLGSALEQLRFSREHLWRECRVAMPSSAGVPRFDHHADVTQIGTIVLQLVLGRPLRADEYPARLASLVDQAAMTMAGGERRPLTLGLHSWLVRALHIDLRRAFASAREACQALEQMLAAEPGYVAAPVALETFLARIATPAASGIEAAPAVDRGAGAPGSGDVPPAPAATMPPIPTQPSAPPPRVDSSHAAAPPPPIAAPPVPEMPSIELSSIDARPFEPDLRQMLQLDRQMTPPGGTPRVPPASSMPMPSTPLQPPAPTAPATRTETTRYDPLPPYKSEPIVDVLAAGHEPRRASEPERLAPMPEPRRQRKGSNRNRLIAAGVATVAILATAGIYAGRHFFSGEATEAVQLGMLVVESNPSGVQVFVDGEARGLTPAKLSVKPGPHLVELRGRGTPRVRTVTVGAGAQVSHYVELAEASTPVTGQLDVRSDPPGAKVTVDGQAAGVSPIVISNLQPGEHTVVLQNQHGSVRHTVTIEPGLTAALVAPMAQGPASGWVSITAPFAMQVFENGRLVGSTESDRIMVAAGMHEFEIVNHTLNFRVTRRVEVAAGKVAPIGIELPNGVVNVNAVPWAEVFIDGRPVGETPIGNLSLPIGPHEVVLRHPQLGERRHALSVVAGQPIRLSVDMNKP